MSMKFILILQICSVLGGSCLPPISDPEIYSSWLKCGKAGFEQGLNVINSLESEDIEESRIYIKFTCQEVESSDI